MKLDTGVQNIMHSSPVHWAAIAEVIDHQTLAELSRDLTATAEFFARAAFYFNSRASGGTHDRAVEVCQCNLTAARKLLGLSGPDNVKKLFSP